VSTARFTAGIERWTTDGPFQGGHKRWTVDGPLRRESSRERFPTRFPPSGRLPPEPAAGGYFTSPARNHPAQSRCAHASLCRGFFIIALIAAFFGFGGIAAGAAGIAKILFVVFLIGALVSVLVSLGRRA